MRVHLRVVIAAVLAIGVLGALSSVAIAANAHFKHGGEPVCTVTNGTNSSSTTCTASLTGLGSGDLDVNVTVSGFAVYQCQNPGGNIAPGQNRVLEGPTTAPTTIPANQIKNGNVTFTTNPATLTAAPTASAADAGCPSSGWSGVNPTLTVTSIEMTISQGDTQLFDCKASSPSGLSGSVPLTC